MDNKELLVEFGEVCKPVVEFLRKYGNPHSKAIIYYDFAEFTNAELGMAYPVKD